VNFNTIRIPASMKQIEDSAFCSSYFSNIIFDCITPPSFGANVFENAFADCIISIPKGGDIGV